MCANLATVAQVERTPGYSLQGGAGRATCMLDCVYLCGQTSVQKLRAHKFQVGLREFQKRPSSKIASQQLFETPRLRHIFDTTDVVDSMSHHQTQIRLVNTSPFHQLL